MGRLKWDVVRNNIAAFLEHWHRQGRPIRARIVFVENPVIHPADEVEKVRELWASTGLEVTVWRQLDRIGNVSLAVNQQSPSHQSKKIIGCKMGYMRNRIAILYNGDVNLCCQDWSRSHFIGNVSNKSVTDIWNSQERRRSHGGIYSGEAQNELPCSNCELGIVATETIRI
ncbi:SPASM domain-containing protein [Labrenzia sp. DG1229]|uniref:SPASM domain-containing protein n=1 Tax=Labrenzia sp. DG1229 TaxID=681847 RepID=UPI000490D6FC|nr:SPASM domain-containing protein [Labrenzia sp. DG1229]